MGHSSSQPPERQVFRAAGDGKEQQLEELLQSAGHGLHRLVNSRREKNKDTPLMVAASHGHVKCVQYLLSAGADPNVRNKRGETALHLSITHNNSRVAQDETSLTGEFQECDGRCVTQVLLRNGADPNIQTIGGNSSLHVALVEKNYSAAFSLVNIGDLNLDLINKRGETALVLAIEMQSGVGNILAKVMISKGADVQGKESAETPLIAASICDNFEIVEVLLQAGADLNFQDMHRSSALDYAIRNDNLHIATALLRAGVDDDRLLHGYNERNQRVPLDATTICSHSSPLTLIDFAISDDMAKLLLRAICAALLWSRRKHFMMFLYFYKYISPRSICGLSGHANAVIDATDVTSTFDNSSTATAVNKVFDIRDLTRYICMYL